ncbi:MAG: type IV pilus assembly protein PilM [Nitrospirota bacterium]
MAKRIVGIDIGDSSIKVVQLKRGMMNLELRESFVREIPQNTALSRDDDIADILRELFHSKKIRGDILTVSMPCRSLSTRIITLPFADPKKIEQVIGYEIENQIPFSIDEVIIDYQIIESNPEGSKILVIIAPKETIRSNLSLLSKAGIDPSIIDIDSFALYSFSQYYLKNGQDDVIIIDIGASTTAVAFIVNRRLYGIRNITMGGDTLTMSISKRLSISFDEAERYKYEMELSRDGSFTYNSGEGDIIIKGELDALVTEIKNTIHIYETETERSMPYLFICGGGSKLRGIREYLSIELNKEITDISKSDPSSKTGLIDKNGDISHDPLFSHGLGLVLREALKKRGSEINLRKEEFVYGKIAKESISKLVSLLGAGILVIILLLSNLYLKYYIADIRVKGLKEEIRGIFKKQFPDVKNIVNEIHQIKGKIKELKRDVSVLGNSDFTILNILKELTESIPDDTKIDIHDLTIDNDKIRIEAETDSFESADKIKNEFNKIGFIKDVNISDAKVSADQTKVKFRINITIVKGI